MPRAKEFSSTRAFYKRRARVGSPGSMQRAAIVLSLASVAAGCARSAAATDGGAPDARSQQAMIDGGGSAQEQGDAARESKALREAVLASSRAYDTVRALTDEAGPRLSGSPGGAIAIAWAKRA